MAENVVFNPNELLLEKVRYVEEYDPSTMELMGRYTQIENPSLQTSANGTQVTDAMGAEIVTFYNAQQGTFSFTNSLHSLDLMASQFGSEKEVAGTNNKFLIPVSELVTIDAGTHKATLKYKPVGTTGAEVAYAKVINDDNTYGATYRVDESAGEGTFAVNADEQTLEFAEDVTGRVFVQYERETERAVRVVKRTDGLPPVRTLLIHVIFHDPCDSNLVYAGLIYVPRAQINPESVELNLTSDGKHAATYRLQKAYCSEDGKLFEIIVTAD